MSRPPQSTAPTMPQQTLKTPRTMDEADLEKLPLASLFYYALIVGAGRIA